MGARWLLAAIAVLAACGGTAVTPTALPSPTGETAFRLRRVADTGGPKTSIRLARDPVSGALFVLKFGGDILRVDPQTGTLTRVYTPADTGVTGVQGMAFGPDGALYLVANQDVGVDNQAVVRRGLRGTWTTLARTVPYPPSDTAFDHRFNGVVVSPDGRSVYVSSGSRTDHGEVQSTGGRFPGVREVPLTARMFRLPADATDLVLPNDEAALAPYAFARGLRNSFDPAFDASGELFSGDNSGDRDDEDELNWLREGGHYGFPWRMGTNDTPQQFAGYDPEKDRLVDHRFHAYQSGAFHDDPTYPPRPAGMIDPIPNLGPDANRFRDPVTGVVRTATEAGRTLATFTTHRSPLGLVFDTSRALPGRYAGGAFILGWTRGDASGESVAGPMRDASEDLLFLDLQRSGTSYTVRAQSVVCGFLNPIDTAIVGAVLYVLEFGGNGTIWEVTPPPSEPTAGRTCTTVPR